MFSFKQKKVRRQYKTIVEESFNDLSPTVTDAFFDNFGYTMPLSLISKINRLCRELKPFLVVEIGSGVSTMAIAKAIAKTNGVLISIEERIEYLKKTRSLLKNCTKSILLCSSTDGRINYNTLSKALSLKNKPELLVIDGPADEERFSADALKFYQELLFTNCVCAIDDTDREENDLGASRLARDFSLCKVDYRDPIYVNHQYSILFPSGKEDHALSYP